MHSLLDVLNSMNTRDLLHYYDINIGNIIKEISIIFLQIYRHI
jgi:hypothetical protein